MQKIERTYRDNSLLKLVEFRLLHFKEKRSVVRNFHGVTQRSACLNCNTYFQGNYCHHCGQKATTTRFTVRQVFSSDLLNGLYNVNSGFLFTFKQLFTRPGHAVRDYIEGKRAAFFNYFTLFILVLTFSHLVHESTGLKVEDLFVTHVSKKVISVYEHLMRDHGKLLAFALIPVNAFSSYCLFKKARQTYAEHLVLSIYKSCGSSFILSLFYLVALFIINHTALKVTYVFFSLFQIAYEFIFCYQYFSVFQYTKAGLTIRSILVSLLIIFLFIKKWILIF